MDGTAESPWVTDDWLVDEVLQRYPSTSAIFLQYGPACRTRPDRLFPDYPPMTVKEYTDLRGVNKKSLLRHLNAFAETEAFARKHPWLLNCSRIGL
jgi:hypothetical protein